MVGDVTKTEFEQRYNKLFPAMADTYKILVIFDVKKQEVIGAGSLIIEHKFIRQLGTAGHIEDIVVKPGYRGKNLGLRLIEVLKQIAVVNGCYKVLLDCDERNVKFYEKVSSRLWMCGIVWFESERSGDGVVCPTAESETLNFRAEFNSMFNPARKGT